MIDQGLNAHTMTQALGLSTQDQVFVDAYLDSRIAVGV
jgi:hypothetical protein